jgi:hypothetical protein
MKASRSALICPRKRTNLVVLTMHYHDRNVDHRQIIVKLGLGQNSDAFELRLDASHHSLSPPGSIPLSFAPEAAKNGN